MSKTTFIGLLLIIFLASIFVQTAASDTPEITIFSPENRTYFDENISLKFRVEEPPILVGYQVDDENTKWFMIKDYQIAPVLKKSIVVVALQTHDMRDDIVIRFPEDNGVGFQNFYNRSGILEAEFAVIDYKTQFVSKYVYRASNTTVPLKIGVDLELLEDFIIVPLNFLKTEAMDLVVAKKSDFTDLTNETLFEFELKDITLGRHNLTVFAIDTEGVETSMTKTFSIKIQTLIESNSIDKDAAFLLLHALRDYSNTYVDAPGIVCCDYNPQFHEYDYVFIMGGPKAPIKGNTSSKYLTEAEQKYLINVENATGYWVKPSNYSTHYTNIYQAFLRNPEIKSGFDKQKVVVVAGHTRKETLAATELFVKEGIDELFRR